MATVRVILVAWREMHHWPRFFLAAAGEKKGGRGFEVKYDVWYEKPNTRGDRFFRPREGVTMENLPSTHVLIQAGVEADDLDDLYRRMQAEFWSPHGEARPLIQSEGLDHTSMSVGDAAVRKDAGELWVCDTTGWKKA